MSGVQRSLLSWAMLTLLLTAGTSLANVNILWLTSTVEFIRTRYTERDQFCAAVKIPESLLNEQNPDLQGLLSRDTDEEMQNSFQENDAFYNGYTVAAAKPTDKHAEYRVLEQIEAEWSAKRTKHFLLIYTYLSPCAYKCAKRKHGQSILKFIDFMKGWDKGYAIVFQQPYNNPITEEVNAEKLKALNALGKGFGYENIFRCYKPVDKPFHCIKCFIDPENIVDDCYQTKVEGPSATGGGAKRSGSPSTSSSAKKGRVTHDSNKNTD